MRPGFNGSSVLQPFECGNAVKIQNNVRFLPTYFDHGYMSVHEVQEILGCMSVHEVQEILGCMSMHEVQEILGCMSMHEVQEILPDTNMLLLYISTRGLCCFDLAHLHVLAMVDRLGCMVFDEDARNVAKSFLTHTLFENFLGVFFVCLFVCLMHNNYINHLGRSVFRLRTSAHLHCQWNP